MLKRVFMLCVLVCGLSHALLFSETQQQQEVRSNWNDFLHYATIGRFELARGFAQKLIDSSPDPVFLLKLSEENPKGFKTLLRMNASSDELAGVSGEILSIIEDGRYVRRTDADIILQEIDRLSSTIRGRIAAEEHLRNAGEYAVPFMLDVLADTSRSSEYSNITQAIVKIGRNAIRPLVAALNTRNVAVKAQIVRVLGEIGYPQVLPYLKYIQEKDESSELRTMAEEAISQIDSNAAKIPSAELFFQLGESYYNHKESLAPMAGYDYANIWFWDQQSQRLTREEVDPAIFYELMSMRSCEWALKADSDLGKAIGLWLAAFFKAESTGLMQPAYFGQTHPDAMTYATTAGAEYLHQALERALQEDNPAVALGAVEALAANAGEKSLLYRIGTEQPLIKALSYRSRAVRYSAAIAIGGALPTSEFMESKLIATNLAEAVTEAGLKDLGRDLIDAYAVRSMTAMLSLAMTNNTVVDLVLAQDTLIAATNDSRENIQILAGQTLAWMSNSDCQRAIFKMAMDTSNSFSVRSMAFQSLAVSAKNNANLLDEMQINKLYTLISSGQTDPAIKAVAAGAFGALNLPSRKVKDLILEQAVY